VVDWFEKTEHGSFAATVGDRPTVGLPDSDLAILFESVPANFSITYLINRSFLRRGMTQGHHDGIAVGANASRLPLRSRRPPVSNAMDVISTVTQKD